MSVSPILIEKQDSVGFITLNRPKALNSFNPDLMLGIHLACQDLANDDHIRCVVIRGAGEHFSVGGDIQSFTKLTNEPPQLIRESIDETIHNAHSAITLIQQMPKPVLASVHGSVAGFGLSLVCACDMVITAESTVFVAAYTQIGISPDGGVTYALPRMIGIKKAFELLLLNERLNSSQAKEYGLINWIVEDSQLEQKTFEMAQKLANGATYVYSRTKMLLNKSIDNSLEEQLSLEQESFKDCAIRKDFKEGITSFLTKKPPNFQGN